MPEQSAQEQYAELSYYTLAHSDRAFIHQHIVDVFIAQTADNNTKAISINFALIGLYLYLEKGFSGRQVQVAHMQLSKLKKQWHRFDFPEFRGSITVADVLATEAGHKRDDMIRQWCVSVWEAWHHSHSTVIDLAKVNLSDLFI